METKLNILTPNSILTMLTALMAFSFSASSKNITWTGSNSKLWSNASNWNGGIPTATDNVIISHTINQPVLDVDATIASVMIDGRGLSCTLILDGVHSLNVNGNVVVKNHGKDKIGTSSSTVTLTNAGSLSGGGEMDLSGNGKLYISGNLTITDMIAGLSTGSLVVFNGTSQTINNGKEYHFNDLNIHSGTTDLVHTNLKIDGDLLGGGTLNGENNKIQLGGDMMLVNYVPGTSTFELASGNFGSPSVQHLNANSFYVLENFDQKTVLSGPIKVVHQLDFEKGNIYLGNVNVSIANNASLTRGDDKEISHSEMGSRGYFITDGKGLVHMMGGIVPSKSRSKRITQCVSCDLGLADNK